MAGAVGDEVVATAGGAPAPPSDRAAAALKRDRKRAWLSFLLGLIGFGLAVLVFTQLGNLGLGLFTSALIVLGSLAMFIGIRVLVVRMTAPDTRPTYPVLLALPSLAYYTAFFLLPLGFLCTFALATPTGFGEVVYAFDLNNFSQALDQLYIDVFLRTLRFALVGTILTVAFGYPLAYWIVRYAPAHRRGLFLLLIIVPFLTAQLIRSYSFLIVLSDSFYLSTWLKDIGLTDGDLGILYTNTSVQIGIVYTYLPLLVLPVYASLERMDWTLVDAASDLGSKPLTAFRQITLRLTAPGLITGVLLVFIPMMGEYVIPLVLGGGNIDLIGNVIQRSFLEQQNYPFGSAMALLVMGALSMVIVIYLYLATQTEEQFGS